MGSRGSGLSYLNAPLLVFAIGKNEISSGRPEEVGVIGVKGVFREHRWAGQRLLYILFLNR